MKINTLHAVHKTEHITTPIGFSTLCSVNVCEEERKLWLRLSTQLLKNGTYRFRQKYMAEVESFLKLHYLNGKGIPQLENQIKSLRREKNNTLGPYVSCHRYCPILTEAVKQL
jgi:hypothetical protein